MLTVFNVLSYLTSILLAVCEGATVPVHNLKMYIEWGYIPLVLLLLLDRCWFSVSSPCRFISDAR
jgi:hypothetical protein